MNLKVIKGKHPLSIHVVWMILIIGALAMYRFRPPSTCLFHNLTGVPCLSCGVTRAVGAFFSGEFISMLCFNPLAVLFCAALFFFSLFKLVEYIFRFKLRIDVSSKISLAVRVTVIFLVAANWLFLIAAGR
ncbi:MAG: DUF2752 domain-containing protein [candidate division Zixibacteria bacterium]|nr:DUF2752 domain-containing protein [candidate division Zixibacteria bacterium]